MTRLGKILSMADADIQSWLRLIKEEDLLKGMTGISNEVRKRILANMSDRAGKAINEYLEKNKGLGESDIATSLDKLENALKTV